MAKKKLSAFELKMKKLATLAMAKFATKEELSSVTSFTPSNDPASLLS